MIWEVRRLVDDELLGTISAPSIKTALATAADSFGDEDFYVVRIDASQKTVAEWRRAGKVVARG